MNSAELQKLRTFVRQSSIQLQISLKTIIGLEMDYPNKIKDNDSLAYPKTFILDL